MSRSTGPTKQVTHPFPYPHFIKIKRIFSLLKKLGHTITTKKYNFPPMPWPCMSDLESPGAIHYWRCIIVWTVISVSGWGACGDGLFGRGPPRDGQYWHWSWQQYLWGTYLMLILLAAARIKPRTEIDINYAYLRVTSVSQIVTWIVPGLPSLLYLVLAILGNSWVHLLPTPRTMKWPSTTKWVTSRQKY